ncbi:MAG: hypothetical protein GQ582_13510 [Methyloprofundus sp.]|nr:hypothetical protein [Methyloprofundus sp.]
MLALVLSMMVIGGVVSMYISTIRASSDTLNSVQLNHDLDSIMQVMSSELRRAGSWGGAIAGSDARENPFVQNKISRIQIGHKDGEEDDSCILYAYDADGNGVDEDPKNLGKDYDGNALVVLSRDELYGFRLNNGGIDMRLSVASTTDKNALDADEDGCDEGTWRNIIDTGNVAISELSFSIERSKCFNKDTNEVYAGEDGDTSCAQAISEGDLDAGNIIETLLVDIELEGEAKGDDESVKSLVMAVKVRNNRIFTQP